jgi:GcrA cell cycle regulator
MDWNEDTIARIRALWAEGHSTAEIGRRMGISKNAVVGKAHRLNLPARPSPIRRGTGEKRPPRQTVRRITGPTLPALQSVERQAAMKPPVALRAVPSQPRPAGRISSCCWPLGEPGTVAFRFCGDPTVPAKPYCDEHVAIAYVKVRDRREDAA